MTKPRWKDGEHPNADLLLLSLEGELEPKEAAGIEEHLKHCWSCRARSARMQRSICAFVDHRDTVVLPKLPSPPSTTASFLARLHRVAADLEIASSRNLLALSFIRDCAFAILGAWSRYRPYLISATVATAMAALLVILPVINPPAISAAVFLERARGSQEASLRVTRRSGIYQRVEIRHAGRAMTRELFLGLPKPSRLEIELRRTDFEDLFRKVGFNWDDPLSVESFADWRGSLVQRNDTIRTADNMVTLTTRGDANNPIVEASLTVRQADWHPVAERIQLRDVVDPVEVAEVDFEVREIGSAFEPKPRLLGAPHVATPAPELAPSQEELEIAEAQLREAFHQAGADLREAPQVWREGNQVRFYILTETVERKREILRFVEAIPHVSESPDPQPSHASEGTPPSNPPDRLRTIDPPLAKALEGYWGGVDLATQYLDRVHDTYLTLVAEASALDRLGARYPPSGLTALPAEARTPIIGIAADHVAHLQSLGADYIAVVSPVLDEMLRRNAVLDPAVASQSIRSCGNWQAEAADFVKRLRQFQEPFSRLFVRHQVEEDVTPTTEDLLGAATMRRAAIVSSMQTLCLPE
jgi:hypothetical protein